MKKNYLLIAALGLFAISCNSMKNSNVVIYDAPEGEILNTKYTVTADGFNVPVYNAKVGIEDREKRNYGMDAKAESANFFDIAGFAYFDMKQGPVTVTVSVDEEIKEAKVLPTSYGIVPTIEGKKLTFQVEKPQNLTIDINGDYVRSLHLFVNPEETDIPDPNDPNVIYFGPGIHEVTSMEIGDNKTVYIAGGAIVRGIMGKDEEYHVNKSTGLRGYSTPTFLLKGNNITFRGRGFVDQDSCSTHARNMVVVQGDNINLEGVILRNSSTWTVPVRRSHNIHIDNIKLIGYRANSDGIDICGSEDVLVENCFIRTLDDLIVVKTLRGYDEAKRITARKCVLWNEVAHALSIGAELTKNVEDVVFEDCDIIHDHCREWSLRVYQTDSGLIKNVRFENIRIEQSVRFASLWIGEAIWTSDPERGNIQDIVFKNIQAVGADSLYAEFLGYDKEHAVRNVLLENITLNGKPMTDADVRKNDFVYDVTVK